MKNSKRVLAVIGVILLLAAFCLPMFFAFGKGEGSRGMFLAALGVAIFVPVFAYICMMAVRIFGRKKEKDTGAIRNVVFDMGNVLLDFGWREYIDSFGFPEEKKQKIIQATVMNPVWNERDRGVLTEEEYVDQMTETAPEYTDDIREVMRRSPECTHVFDYALSWVRYLHDAGYHLYVLSNYCDHMFQENLKEMPYLSYMDGVVISYREHLIKPEPEIYQLLLDRYHLKPAETVYLDDMEKNCEAARALGIHAICFQDFKQAAAELEKLGIK